MHDHILRILRGGEGQFTHAFVTRYCRQKENKVTKAFSDGGKTGWVGGRGRRSENKRERNSERDLYIDRQRGNN